MGQEHTKKPHADGDPTQFFSLVTIRVIPRLLRKILREYLNFLKTWVKQIIIILKEISEHTSRLFA